MRSSLVRFVVVSLNKLLNKQSNGRWSGTVWRSSPWFSTKMSSYHYRDSHCGDKTILLPPYLRSGISNIGILPIESQPWHSVFFFAGKRVCPGESLARMEIFLFSVTLIQRFKFKMADNRPSLLGSMGITLIPKPFELIAEPLVWFWCGYWRGG